MVSAFDFIHQALEVHYKSIVSSSVDAILIDAYIYCTY